MKDFHVMIGLKEFSMKQLLVFIFCCVVLGLGVMIFGQSNIPTSPISRSVSVNQVEEPIFTEFYASQAVLPSKTIALRDAPQTDFEIHLDREVNPRFSLLGDVKYDNPAGELDPLLSKQSEIFKRGNNSFLTPIVNVDGQPFSNVNPPDVTGEIGPNHFVQIINGGGGARVRMYDKSGVPVTATVELDNLGTDECSDGFGDGIVLYDHLADRWLLSEFSRRTAGNNMCVYISQTNDPTGNYWAYNFQAPSFPDYPKYGVWDDAYYVTTNEGVPAVYAMDRNVMLTGGAATFQRFTAPILAGFNFNVLTPADIDGATAPPAGTPGIIMRHNDSETHGSTGDPDVLEMWELDIDFDTPANSSFTQADSIMVAEFDSQFCSNPFSCMNQPNNAVPLDAVREPIMDPLQYQNFGCWETIVGNYVTDATGDDVGGIRWFELRREPGQSWVLHQEGTLSPDGDDRWMGAASMDKHGNIAVAYNVTGANTFPSIRYSGREVHDPLGTLPVTEGTLIDGTATNSSSRYGDYSSLSVDPVDECTFWFTGEYNAASTWSTRIGSFKFDSCTAVSNVCSTPPTAVSMGETAVEGGSNTALVLLLGVLIGGMVTGRIWVGDRVDQPIR